MHRDPSSNVDGAPLEADHTLSRSQGGTRADRLLLRICNRSRGDGTRQVDDVGGRPAWWTRDWTGTGLPATSSAAQSRVVVLLCGPAGAGKTTAARESGLTVYDRDDPQWAGEREFTAALENLARDPRARAVVIRSAASSSARAKAAALIGATHTYLLVADPRELAHRVARRNRADKDHGLASIRTWFERFDRDDDVPEFPGWPAVPGLAVA